MNYCYDKGIPHSKFLQWDPEDRAKVVAYTVESTLRCTMCGTASWEWEENRFAYSAQDEFCRGCYQKAVFTDQESTSLPGTNVKLVPSTPLSRAQRVVTAKKRSRISEE